MENTGNILYLCYFGLREPLVQTQVLPYLREIQKLENIKIHLLTFEPNLKEKWTEEQIKAEREKLVDEEIVWHFLPYHKTPSAPATLFDVLNGARFTRNLIRRENIKILHARIHTPAMMGAIAKKLSRKNVKMLFDIRGFFPDEYTDAGIWEENGWLYKSVKRIERWLLREADGFVVLTEKAREILFPESKSNGFDQFGRPVEVIPCCVNFDRFEAFSEDVRHEMRSKLNVENRRVITYVGSFGGWYLTEEMIDFFGTARERDASTFALVLTQSDPETIAELLKTRGFSKDDFLIRKVLPEEIPRYLSASDIAISFIKACYSKQASSPTKIAEYLASGLPVISNSGVGDLDELIESEKIGVILGGFSKENYLDALSKTEKLMRTKNLKDHCRAAAVKHFDLRNVGGEKYRRIYDRLLEDK